MAVTKPGEYDINFYKGMDYEQTFTYKVGGAAVNLTGYSARLMIRKKIDDASPVVSLTNVAGEITLGGAAGTIVVERTAAQTALFGWKQGVWDLELVSGAGKVTRLLQGKAYVHGEVTR